MLAIFSLVVICLILWGYLDARTPSKIIAVAKGNLASMIYRNIEIKRERWNKNGAKRQKYREYRFYNESSAWKSIVSSSLRAMKNKCEFCGNKAQSVHHWNYPEREDLGLEGIASLIVVCNSCHAALHGKSSESSSHCALCRTASNESTITIDIRKYELGVQKVCKRCKNIATGHRYRNNNMKFSEYEKWVHDWENGRL